MLDVAGFVPLSLCDYPGWVAAVVFTQGCNFRCPWCHTPRLIPRRDGDGAGAAAARRVLDLLAARRTRLGGVVVSGGEPPVHAATLPPFLREVKALGLPVKLDTNGSRPDVLRRLFAEGLVDYVAMDIKAPWPRYDALTGVPGCDVEAVKASVALIAASGLPHRFRTTRVEPLLSPGDCEALRAQVPCGSEHVWQAFRAPAEV